MRTRKWKDEKIKGKEKERINTEMIEIVVGNEFGTGKRLQEQECVVCMMVSGGESEMVVSKKGEIEEMMEGRNGEMNCDERRGWECQF